jgi:hypothetical protein
MQLGQSDDNDNKGHLNFNSASSRTFHGQTSRSTPTDYPDSKLTSLGSYSLLACLAERNNLIVMQLGQSDDNDNKGHSLNSCF